jgi:hypothetical protein
MSDSSVGTRATAALGRPVAGVFGVVARLRSGPAIHAVGTSYRGTVTVAGGLDLGLPLFDEPSEYQVLVRLSRSVGLPQPLPDVHGMAIRFDADPPQDLLLDSNGAGPVTRHLIRFGRSVVAGSYGTLIAYRAGSRLVHIGAFADGARSGQPPEKQSSQPLSHGEAQGARFRLAVAEPFGRRWRTWATLHVAEPVERPDLRFSPASDGLGVSMRAGWMAGRRSSYRRSQQYGPFDGAADQGRPAGDEARRPTR